MGSIVMEPDDLVSFSEIYVPSRNLSSVCASAGKINSNGIFNDSNPLDYSVPLLLGQLILASSLLLLTSRILRPLGQPSIIIQILSGVAVCPSFLGRITVFRKGLFPLSGLVILDTLALFGYILYFFIVGVQMDPWLLRRIGRKELIIGISHVILGLGFSESVAFLVLTGNRFDLDPDLATSLPVMAAASSVLGFPGVSNYLIEFKMVNSKFGKTALRASVVSNLFSFCIVTLIFLASEQSSGRLVWLGRVIACIALAATIFFLVRPLIMLKLKRQPAGEPFNQNFIYMLFAGVLLSAFCSKAIGVSIFLGPLLYGIAIPSGPPLGSALVEKLDIMTNWLFVPLYFVKTGLVTDVFSLNVLHYLIGQGTIFMGVLGKFIGPLISSIYFKVPLRDAISTGLVMNVHGLVDFGLFKSVKQSKAASDEAFLIMCISMLIVTASVTHVLRYLYDPSSAYAVYKRRTVLHTRPDTEFKLLACVYSQENTPTTINLLEALNPNRRSPFDICVLHLVKLVGRADPLLIPHRLARSYQGNPSASKSIINAFKLFQQHYFSVVTIESFTSVSPYASMHDLVCSMASERRVPLILLPFHRQFLADMEGENSNQGIKLANEKIIEMAPCSVGVIVDKRRGKTSRPLLEAGYSYSVAVLFLGGPDDREAVAIGTRMVGTPNVYLTIVRITGNETNTSSNMRETKLDDLVVNETRAQLPGKIQAAYVEEPVSDVTETLTVLRNMDRKYELIIVGKRHDLQSPLLQGLADWSEESELGLLGDVLASSEINSSSSLLVVQQHDSGFEDLSEVKRYEPQLRHNKCLESERYSKKRSFHSKVVASDGRHYLWL